MGFGSALEGCYEIKGLLELVWKPDAGGLVLVRVIVPCAGMTGLPGVLVRIMLLKTTDYCELS
jgi:hypothetical protein